MIFNALDRSMFGSIDTSSWGTEKFGLSASALSSSVTIWPSGCDSVVKGMLEMVKCCPGFNQDVVIGNHIHPSVGVNDRHPSSLKERVL